MSMLTFGPLVWNRCLWILSDLYAVAIKKGGEVIGHVPRKMLAACSLFLQLGIAK